MNTDTASQLVYDALVLGVSGDTDGAIDKLTTVGEQGDHPLMYGVCCGLAETGALMLRKIYGDQAPKTPEDGMFVFQELKPGAMADDPAQAFSVRFLTAWANGDRQTTDALYTAATHASDEQYVASICALFADVVGITRLALNEQQKST